MHLRLKVERGAIRTEGYEWKDHTFFERALRASANSGRPHSFSRSRDASPSNPGTIRIFVLFLLY